MEAVKITRKEYTEGVELVGTAAGDGVPYLDQFEIEFPDGLANASTMEVCRIMQNPDFDSRVHLLKVCIAGKNVKVKCPNGETYSFCLSSVNDGFDGFDLFRNEPLALWALADTVYGYVIKKSVRPLEAHPASRTM